MPLHLLQVNEKLVQQSAKVTKKQQDAARPKRAYMNYTRHRGAMMNAILTALLALLTPAMLCQLLRNAAQNFQAANPGADVAYPMYLARDVWQRMSLRGDLLDAPRSGRPRQLSDDHVDKLIAAFKQGFTKYNEHTKKDEFWGYTSIAHAVTMEGEFKRLYAATEGKGKNGKTMNMKHIWSRMQQRHVETHGRAMRRIIITVKPHMTAETKRQRLAVAREWRTWGRNKLLNVVWIDEKQEYIKLGGKYACYAPDGVVSFQREYSDYIAKASRVKWIAATSARLGCPYFDLITGTTDMETGYKVRTRTCVPAWADPHTALRICRALPPRCINDV